MALDRIKSILDINIKRDFAKFSNAEIIADLITRADRYKIMLEKINPETEAVRHSYINSWVESATERISDMHEIERLETILNIDRVKLLELIDLRKKINN